MVDKTGFPKKGAHSAGVARQLHRGLNVLMSRSKKHYKPKLDPKRDLGGATPEALVRTLFRRVELLDPRPTGHPVVGDELSVGDVTSKPDGDLYNQSQTTRNRPHDLSA